MLKEIIVTAGRRTENLQKSSIALQVLSAQELVRAGVSQPTDLNTIAPGLMIGQAGDAAQVFIRGVGDYSATQLSNPGVAFNVDGVYTARPEAIGSNFYDIQRIEVLKGPQGTLYGRNAEGGAVNLITNRPDLSGVSGYLTFEGGNFGLFHETGAINLPVTSTFALRGAFNLITRKGYLTDGTDDDHEQAARIEALWKPTDSISWLTTVHYAHIGGKGPGYTMGNTRPAGTTQWLGDGDPRAVAYMASQVIPAPLPPIAALQAYGATFPPGYCEIGRFAAPGDCGPGGVFVAKPYVSNGFANFSPYEHNRSLGISSEFKIDLGWATLTLLPSYEDLGVMEHAYPGNNYTAGLSSKSTSDQVWLAHEGDPLRWIAGLYYYNEHESGFDAVDEGFVLINTQFPANDTRSYAAFGEATYSVTHKLRLVGGLRYSNDSLKAHGVEGYVVAPFVQLQAPVPSVSEPWSGTPTFNSVTWKGGIEYDLAAENMLYFTASTGYKAGSMNFEVPPNTVQPEKLTAFELGSRNRFLDNRLQVNLELFKWHYTHHQEGVSSYDNIGAQSFIVYNVGDADLRGFDFDIAARVTEHDTFRATTEYNRTKYTSFELAQPITAIVPGLTTTCPLSTPYVEPGLPIPFENELCSGRPLARAPLWAGSAGWQHRLDLSSGGSLVADLNINYASHRYATVNYASNVLFPDYITESVDLTYVPANGNWTLTGYVHNISDALIATGAQQSPSVPTLGVWNVNPPRMYGGRITYNFK